MLHVNSGQSNARQAHGGASSDASGSTMPSVKVKHLVWCQGWYYFITLLQEQKARETSEQPVS